MLACVWASKRWRPPDLWPPSAPITHKRNPKQFRKNPKYFWEEIWAFERWAGSPAEWGKIRMEAGPLATLGPITATHPSAPRTHKSRYRLYLPSTCTLFFSLILTLFTHFQNCMSICSVFLAPQGALGVLAFLVPMDTICSPCMENWIEKDWFNEESEQD